MKEFVSTVTLTLIILVSVNSTFPQKPAQPPKGLPAPAIFAVINDGKTIEPIAFVEKGELVNNGDSNANAALAKGYYKAGSKYDLIFGGAVNGSVVVKRSNVGTECGGSSATVVVQSQRAKLSGFVMGLAINFPLKAKHSGTRRMPTVAERSEIEALVREEFRKNKVPPAALKQLRYYNLTAVDVDGDGAAELIGSYWVAPGKDRRDLLFFIAEKDSAGKYKFTHSDFQTVKPKDIMSGSPSDLDTMGGESFLDLLDYNGDGVDEIFTIEKAFEGNNYHVYMRKGVEWQKVMDVYDYRCAY